MSHDRPTHGLQPPSADIAVISLESLLPVLDVVPDCVVISDAEGNLIAVNEAFTKLYGYTREEALQLNARQLIRSDYHPVFFDFRQQLATKGVFRGHTIDVRKDGSEFHTDVRGRAVRAGDRLFLAAVIRDVTHLHESLAAVEQEVKSLTREVDRKTARITEISRELEDFAYSVSHDLRAPLRHIDSFAQLLERRLGEQQDEKVGHYLRRIHEAADRMQQLIDDILQYSRAGRVELRITAVDMNTLVDEVIAAAKAVTADRRIVWQRDELPTVSVDRELFRRVWENLIGNAVKFTVGRDEAHIHVGLRDDENEYIFFVKDDGCGFDPEFGYKLFRLFQRLHADREKTGAGIGLANVRRIVGRHHGRVWAEGQPGKGAVFYFSLPKQNNDTAREPEPEEKQR
ncbi:MAG: PAS domain S-box protein [Planctomycetota bacterium]|nr:MAG: PAS domain S-box protein [Planctomycetota bacterium]